MKNDNRLDVDYLEDMHKKNLTYTKNKEDFFKQLED
jgi:hypothetical protein